MGHSWHSMRETAPIYRTAGLFPLPGSMVLPSESGSLPPPCLVLFDSGFVGVPPEFCCIRKLLPEAELDCGALLERGSRFPSLEAESFLLRCIFPEDSASRCPLGCPI